jgi:hypothetical protein
MHLRALHIPAAVFVLAVATSVSGAACIQPEDTFDDFAERYKDTNQGSTSEATVTTGQIVGCVPPGPDSAVAGTYIFALSVQLGNKKPLFFKADVTFGDPETAPSISMKLTALGTPYIDGTDAFAEIPPTLDIGPIPLNADGTFSAKLPELSVNGDANSITGSDIVATISIDSGQVCEVNEGQAPAIICGTISGDVTEPISLKLDPAKNFYAMTKYDGAIPNDPTTIVYDCAGSMGQAP